MAMSNASFKGRVHHPYTPVEPGGDGGNGAEVPPHHPGSATQEQAVAAAHTHHAKNAHKVGMTS